MSEQFYATASEALLVFSEICTQQKNSPRNKVVSAYYRVLVCRPGTASWVWALVTLEALGSAGGR